MVIDRLRYDRTLNTEKRNLTGSFYTPEPLAKLMCAVTIANYLSEASKYPFETYLSSLLQRHLLEAEVFRAARKAIMKWVVVDLCAGTGAFPLAYFDLLSEWHDRHSESCEITSTKADFISEVIRQFIVLDIQAEPLELYKEEMAIRYHIDRDVLPVYEVDALNDAALQKIPMLSHWFNQGVDLVLGNPPYLGEKSHKGLFQELRLQPFGSRYYEGRMDYFYYFIYRALEILKPHGELCYITTNYFTNADGAKKLRETLKQMGSWQLAVNFNDAILFKDAMGQHNAIYLFEKFGTVKEMKLLYPLDRQCDYHALVNAILEQQPTDTWHYSVLNQPDQYDDKHHIKFVPMTRHQAILNRLAYAPDGKKHITLGEAFHVQQGIVSGFDKTKTQGVFVLNDEEAQAHQPLKNWLKPFYKNKQVRKYRVLKPAYHHILYLDGKEEDLSESVIHHLKPYQERLSSRREVLKGIRPWYALQWPREKWRFEGPLIASPQRAFVNVFAYEPNDLYGSADIYYISDKRDDDYRELRTLFMTGYLNSIIVYYWLHLMGKRKGSMLELYATPLKDIPIPLFDVNNEQHQMIVSQVNAMRDLLLSEPSHDEVQSLQDNLDQLFADYFGLTEHELAHIKCYKQDSGALDHEQAYWDL